ncbi:MAG: succinylglutamate desuccinylase [Oleiphilaceae bacterium]|nr:succinylglutamate desuccinylase [Oleiphilaceae bacterium]
MTVLETLFEGHRDWLTFTLAKPDSTPGDRQAYLPDGSRMDMTGSGILRLIPALPRDNARLILSAGIHGDETAPIELLNNLVTGIINGELEAARETLLILGNPPAMVAGKRAMTYNLNRLFNGVYRQPGYIESADAGRARLLEKTCHTFASGADELTHYDLHTAMRPSRRERFAVYPCMPDRELPEKQLRFLAAADVNTLLLKHGTDPTFSSFTAWSLDAESMTIELGQARPFGQNNLSQFAGVDSCLRDLLAGRKPDPGVSASVVDIFEVVEEIVNTGNSFRFHVPDDAANFTEYPPGALIWEDEWHSYKVGDQPESVVFPNPNVPVGDRVGLMVRRLSSPSC